MKSLNKVALMGHLACDPELKTTATGATMATFKLAIERDWKSSSGGLHSATDFHRIVAWGKLAEVVGQYLQKGAAMNTAAKTTKNSLTCFNPSIMNAKTFLYAALYCAAMTIFLLIFNHK